MATHAERITLVVPWGDKRSLKLQLPPEVAGWLRDELNEALGEPRRKTRRPVKIHRGKWRTSR
jgi:hypothetical protein